MFDGVAARWVVLCVLGSLLAGCSEQPEDPRAKPPLVRTAQAGQAGDLNREFSGVVSARVESSLAFRVGGKVVARLVNAGQAVRRGQPLMRMDPADYSLAATGAAGAVEAARARAVQAGAEEARYRDLAGSGAVSVSAFDQVKAEARAARANLTAAEAQLRARRNDAAYTVLVAGADGVVTGTMAEPGQVVAAGQTVITLAQAGPREAVVQLPETLRPPLGTVAQAATYSGLGGTAALRELGDSADPATRTFTARFTLAGPPARAPIGSTVTVRLGVTGAAGHMSVPLAAIDDRGRGPGVWIVQADKVRFRPVQIASITDEAAILKAGLRGDERVVTLGAHLLREGQTVRVQQGKGQ